MSQSRIKGVARKISRCCFLVFVFVVDTSLPEMHHLRLHISAALPSVNKKPKNHGFPKFEPVKIKRRDRERDGERAIEPKRETKRERDKERKKRKTCIGGHWV